MYTVSIKELVTFHCKNRPLCLGCSRQLKRLDSFTRCSGCSRISEREAHCQDCLAWRQRYPQLKLKHQAVYAYNGFAREMVKQFKFSGDCELAAAFSEEIKELTRCRRRSSLVIPIPISRSSIETRGFNQTELLLESARIEYQRVLENAFQREKQSKKTRFERLESPQPFIVRDRMEGEIKGKNLIIVDDIYTTGRTVYHAAQLLSQYNPASISSVSLFR
ncbi:ComF family protein [Alkalibacterium sp.]|nr:MAG: ComF family protein [Alkalibacterium sp.]